MGKNKVPMCECGERLKRIYSRDSIGFTALNLYYCEKCLDVYEVQINKKTLKKLSHKDSRMFLKRKGVLKIQETTEKKHE